MMLTWKFFRPTNPVERVVLVVAGLLLLSPGYAQDIFGVALFLVVVGTQLRSRRMRRSSAPA